MAIQTGKTIMNKNKMLLILIIPVLIYTNNCAASDYTVMSNDTVIVAWDQPAETNISHYTLYMTLAVDTTKVFTSTLPNFDVYTDTQWYSYFLICTPIGEYTWQLSATNSSGLESEKSDPFTVTVKEAYPSKPKKVMLIIKPYKD